MYAPTTLEKRNGRVVGRVVLCESDRNSRLPSAKVTSPLKHNKQYVSEVLRTPKRHYPNAAKGSALCRTPPDTLKDRTQQIYYRGECIGEGGFARCFKVTTQKGNTFAMKTVAKDSVKSEKNRRKLVGEIKVHQSMKHPNIVRFVDCFEDNVNCYIVLEMCSNGSLMEMLRQRKRLTEAETRFFLLQILGAVKYMHSRKVIHRDLKLGNFFLDDRMNVKVGDFGLAALLVSDDERKKTICGTPNYIAPEILFDKENGHSFQVDLWSIGVVMYAMLFGKPPFACKNIDDIYKRIKINQYSFPADALVSETAKSLIVRMLSSDPQDRPSIDDIADDAFFHSGPMPRSIPMSALIALPAWPTLARSAYQSNWILVAGASGVGSYPGNATAVGSEVGKSLTLSNIGEQIAKAQQNGEARILPTSVSPRDTVRTIKTLPAQRRKGALFATHQKPLRPSNLRAVSIAEGRALYDDESRPITRVQLQKSKRSQTGYRTMSSLQLLSYNLNSALVEQRVAHDQVREPFIGVQIHKWVDYTNKYGLGYKLSDGTTGVYFNDSSSIVLAPDEMTVEYVSYVAIAPNRSHIHNYQIDNYPESLSKKVYLLKHFRIFMEENLNTDTRDHRDKFIPGHPLKYMTHYLRTKKAIMFRLSTGEIQFNFHDHVKIILSKDGLTVCIVDSERVRRKLNVLEIVAQMDEDDKLMENLRYAKDQLSLWSEKIHD